MTPAELNNWIEERAEKHARESGAEIYYVAALQDFKSGANLLLPLLLKAIETLEKYKLSETNQDRLHRVDYETAIQIIRHGDIIATETINELIEMMKG